MNKFTWSNTKTKITKHETRPLDEGTMHYPSKSLLEQSGIGSEYVGHTIWRNQINLEVGLDRTTVSFEFFRNQQDAEEYIARFPVGTVLAKESDFVPFDMWGEDGSGAASCNLFFSAGGDGPEIGILDSLVGAGVLDESYRIAALVMEWAGPQKVDWSKQYFGDNWSVAIEMDYCTNHFPMSSLAHLAARIRFATYISGDDFTAGYLSRELEQLLGGVQELAESALSTRNKAGEAGSKASQFKRMQRLEAFFGEVTRLADLVGRMSEQVILDQAFMNAIELEPDLWKQGKGQQAEYETVLRSDDHFKSRYFAIMDRTA